MADDVDLTVPQPPHPEVRRRLAELAAWHDEWMARHLPGAEFDPAGRPEGSDYNQHYLDVDPDPTAEDEFHARARQIMGLTA